MGQYYKIVNLDKREYIKPHDFDDGAKLLEFGTSASGTMAALAILLASGNGKGGGDLRSDNPIVGRWAGDRIVIAGDYDDANKYGINDDENLYRVASGWTNVSDQAAKALLDDGDLREDWRRDRASALVRVDKITAISVRESIDDA